MVLYKDKDQMASDEPYYSRLFVAFKRNDPVSEDELRSDFAQCGEIQQLFFVKDRTSGESKGCAYIQFSKMSEAATALETLNNAPIKNHTGTYRIQIARSRDESKYIEDDPDRYLQLFVKVPKTATETDIREYYSQFGNIRAVKLLRVKNSNESRGIAFVRYYKASAAAKAVEAGTNKHGFKAVISRPHPDPHPPANLAYENTNFPLPDNVWEPPTNYTHENTNFGVPGNITSNFMAPEIYPADGVLQASVSPRLNENQIFRLFDVAPGLRDIGITAQNIYRLEVMVRYNSWEAAEYAVAKLHGIEYPLGEFVSLKMRSLNLRNADPTPIMLPKLYSQKRDLRGFSVGDNTNVNNRLENFPVKKKLIARKKAFKNPKNIPQFTPLSPKVNTVNEGSSKVPFCNFELPEKKPMVPRSAFHEITGMCLVLIGHPTAPPGEVINDVYCRFGNFAGFSLGSENYCHLYFACPTSARKAIAVTNGKVISGMTIKILKGDPGTDPGTKRKKQKLSL